MITLECDDRKHVSQTTHHPYASILDSIGTIKYTGLSPQRKLCSGASGAILRAELERSQRCTNGPENGENAPPARLRLVRFT